ncbi:hypothetical protein [Salibacterium aidingense]|uniref:hypothetical protein n=1 Tax=Salibacterium aidingense TaxID=384933 RepID=UPI003BE2C93E
MGSVMDDQPRYTAEDIAQERRQQALARVELLREYGARIQRLEAELSRLETEKNALEHSNKRLRAALTVAKGYTPYGAEEADSGRRFDERR